MPSNFFHSFCKNRHDKTLETTSEIPLHGEFIDGLPSVKTFLHRGDGNGILHP
jgi:hypothetical protein